MSNGATSGNPDYWGGQQAFGSSLFGPGGLANSLMSGGPDPGYQRQQTQGLEQLKRAQAAAGTLNTPLGTRMQSDYLQKSNMAAGDSVKDWLQILLQPPGNKTKGEGSSIIEDIFTLGFGHG